MWWGIVIFMIVGYGDVYLVIVLGKLLGGIIVVIGIGLFVLFIGIFVFGFLEEFLKKEEMICLYCGKDLVGGGDL